MIRHPCKCTITCTSCNSPMTALFYCNDKWPRSFFIDIRIIDRLCMARRLIFYKIGRISPKSHFIVIILLYSNILAWISSWIPSVVDSNQSIVIAYPQFIIPYKPTLFLIVTSTLLLATVSASFTGLYLGYDYGVIGGFFTLPASSAYFQWPNDSAKGFIASSYVLGGLTSTTIVGLMVDKLGRRTTLLISAGFALLGGLLQTVAVNLAMIYTGRFISGLAVGMSLVAAPLYIAEIAPKQLRGTLGYTIQINIGLGTVVASTVSYGAIFIKGNASFRCILAMQIIPAFVIATGMWFSPTSPRWLIHRNREKSARYNLARLRGLSVDDPRISEEIESIQQSINMDNDAEQAGWRVIIDNGMWRRLLLACGAGALLQLNGINAVTYYSPDILRMSGITDPVQQLALTIATTVSNVVGAIIGTTIVDRYGRRAIMVTGGMLMGVALVAISVLLATHDENERGRTTGYSVLALECLYIAAFAFSWGAITWIYVSEIFPQYVRGKAMTVAAIVCWTCNFCVSQISPLLLSSIGWATFVIYGGICLIGSTWEFFVFPETKQQSIEDIARMFTKKPRNPA